MNMLAELLAGLGLLFVGLRLIGQHLRQAAGGRVRTALGIATVSRWGGLLSGALAGAITQSSNAVTLITANLVHGRVLSAMQAIPVVAGANAGTAVLVFIATVDMRLVVLYLMAVAGLSLHFKLDQHPLRRDWLWAGLGLALLFLGLDFIKHAPAGLTAADWHLLLGDHLSAGLALLLGLLVAMLTQSSSAATILAVASMHSGFLMLEGAFWIMTGANLGSGLAVLLSGSGLKGSGRQLCLVHVLVKLVGTIVVAAGWWGWQRSGAVLPPSGDGAAPLLALLFLAMQVAGALPVALLSGTVARLTARLTASDPVEQASRPHFIYDRAVDDPLNALRLAVLERERLEAALPALLPDLDRTLDPAALTASRHLWAGHRNVLNQTSHFVTALIGKGLAGEALRDALHEQLHLDTLNALQDTLHEFTNIVAGHASVPPLLFNLSESLLTLTGLLADIAGEGGDAADIATLVELTGDRGELLERLRRQLGTDPLADAHRLLLATRLFERAVWLIRRLAIARSAVAQPDSALDSEEAALLAAQ